MLVLLISPIGRSVQEQTYRQIGKYEVRDKMENMADVIVQESDLGSKILHLNVWAIGGNGFKNLTPARLNFRQVLPNLFSEPKQLSFLYLMYNKINEISPDLIRGRAAFVGAEFRIERHRTDRQELGYSSIFASG
ncbi:uncharacterized protein LOC117237996 isoform X1 [Bombus vosnesenskii]|uniref:Uncharacterized protein LOC117237996 isoform X1 n=1 Tax=Bombus vosnesenskii TaxID=207650 RepID=A0A6J3L1N9_9HYME|nr:uncharacterized protein LOC117237996 isoform X1 [Bombus vosnesenskii]